MTKLKNSLGFSAVEALLILIIVGILGFTGWFVYHAQKTANKDLSSNNSTNPTYKKAAVDPYKGWKSASLKYEKMSFKYPSTWQISNTSKDGAGTGGTATPGADEVSLTSATGMHVSIQTGQVGIDTNSLLTGLSTSRPINTLGGNYFLVYWSNKSDTTGGARGTCLSKTATTSTIPSLPSKNIQMASMSDDSISPTANLICIGINSAEGSTAVRPISAFEQNASYSDAKLIIESLTY
jgi:cytoskeletal protein RodZ